MNQVKPQSPLRALYNFLRDEYIDGQDSKVKYPGNVIITDSWLRSEVSIQQAGVSSLSFDFLVNQGNMNVTEQRLNMTDKFAAAHISVMIGRATGNVAATPAMIATGQLHTFPNPAVFTGGAGVEAENLNGLYNGNMKITIDSIVYEQSLDVRRFYRVGTAQQGLTTGDGTGEYGASNWGDYAYPFAPLTPAITLSGTGKNEFILNTPGNLGIDMQATGAQNFAVCYLRGFLIQNVNQR